MNNTSTSSYDVIVIGGGTAGLAAYRQAQSQGSRVLLIESHACVTTCAQNGCMPSKLLIAASESARHISQSHVFGIQSTMHIDPSALWQRVRHERDRFVGFVTQGAKSVEKIQGKAVFKTKQSIEVMDSHGVSLGTYHARSFVIATGSSNVIPKPFDSLSPSHYWTNETVFEQDRIPSSLAVIGGGVIGLELGGAFKALGSQVHVFHAHDFIFGFSPDMNARAKPLFEKDLHMHWNTVIESVQQHSNGMYELSDGHRTWFVERILIASGRKPNLQSLNLEDVFESFQVSDIDPHTLQWKNHPLFFAGDSYGDRPLLHEAAHEGHWAGIQASRWPQNPQTFQRKTPLRVAFTHPQMMSVGHVPSIFMQPLEWANQQERCPTHLRGFVSFDDQGRSRIMNVNHGALTLYFSMHDFQLVGAEMIGPAAEHLAHALAWLIEKKTTLDEMLDFPYYHPVIEEGLRTAVRDAHSQRLILCSNPPPI